MKKINIQHFFMRFRENSSYIYILKNPTYVREFPLAIYMDSPNYDRSCLFMDVLINNYIKKTRKYSELTFS